MKKSLLLLGLLALGANGLDARTLSPSEALARALDTTEGKGRRAPARAIPALTLGSEENPAIYVFNSGDEGYMIISADDVAAPLLGYSDSGSFDPDNMPDNMRWWLERYKSQIETAISNNAGSFQKIDRPKRASIATMMTTKWDQGAPYNYLCPLLSGARTATGCVATAMAQVMKYHNWPDKAAPSANFSYKWQEGNETLAKDFSDFEFKWQNMLDSYTYGQYTTAQGNAVAELMQACGYSLEMRYNLASSYGSAAITAQVAMSLIDYFKYDPSMTIESRSHYSCIGWEDKIYAGLKAGPIVIQGSNPSGTHCFVCDGYNEDGTFHINWGWSGMSDGHFFLDALDPAQQGIGGSSAGYNNAVIAIVDIKPLQGDASSERSIMYSVEGSMVVTTFDGRDGIPAAMYINGSIMNYSTTKVSGKLVCKVEDVNTGKTVKTIELATLKDHHPGHYLPYFEIKPELIPVGTYNLNISVVSNDGGSYPIKYSLPQAGYIEITKTASGSLSANVPNIGDMMVNNIKSTSPFYINRPFSFEGLAAFSSPMDVSSSLMGVLLDTDKNIVGLGETMKQEFTFMGEPFEYVSTWFRPFAGSTITPGTYYFAFYTDMAETRVSEPIEVQVLADPGTPTLNVSSWTIENESSVDPYDLKVTTELELSKSNYFFGNITLAVYDENGYMCIATLDSPMFTMEIGEKKTVTISGSIPALTPGKYIAKLSYNDRVISSAGSKTFTVISSGINDIITDGAKKATVSPNPAVDYTVVTATSDIVRIDVASVSGAMASVHAEIDGTTARLDVGTLTPGLYIARVVTNTGVESVKIIKK